jgi:hypothetical protein
LATAKQFIQRYSTAMKPLIGRELTRKDGVSVADIQKCEERLKLKLPAALRDYYRVAGELPINREHNVLYPPRQLRVENGKLVFMEENQRVVFWGLDMKELKKPDPLVFQANNETPLKWYSEGKAFSDFIIGMWRWLQGFDS